MGDTMVQSSAAKNLMSGHFQAFSEFSQLHVPPTSQKLGKTLGNFKVCVGVIVNKWWFVL